MSGAAETTALDLSIVIPAYNEEARLLGTLQAVRAVLDQRGRPAEVLVVDDGSRDATAAIAERFAREDARFSLLRLPRNQGKGAAVRAGMLAARGARVLFMDADLATPMSELAKLDQALERGADVAIGSRALRDSQLLRRQHPLRQNLGKTFNLLVRLLVAGGIRDTQCGFKLFTREAAHTLFREATIDRFAFDVEILLLCRGRYRIAEVPVVWRHVEESKVAISRDAPRMALDLVLLRLRLLERRWRAR